jgi:hypothetical protein
MPRSYRGAASVLVLLAAVVGLLTVGTAGASSPLPDDVIVLRVDPAFYSDFYSGGGLTSECSAGYNRIQLLTLEGRNAGKGTLCFNTLTGVYGASWYSLALDLHLTGGKLEAFSGASYVPPPPWPLFPAGDGCALLYDVGGPHPSVSVLRCGGPITSAKGRFADRPGWVTFEYAESTNLQTGEVIWRQLPTITIDFS